MDIDFLPNATEETNNNENQLDTKVYKKVYSRNNANGTLIFILDKDPNLALDMSSIELHGKVHIPSRYLIENGAFVKCFSQLKIELDSQQITTPRSRYYYNNI